MRDDIETRLLRAVAVDPSEDQLRRLDDRVARAIAMPASVAKAGSSRAFVVRPLMLALLLLLVASAVGAAMSLLDRMVEESPAGWRTAWDRAELVGQRETDAGLTVTLERAYADLNQVLVGFTVEGLDVTASAADPVEWHANIADPTGRTAADWATGATGREQAETGLSAFIQTWEGDPAQVGGTWVLTFTSIGHPGEGMVPGQCMVGASDPECLDPEPSGMIDGNWTFRFELPAPAGTVVTPNVTDTASGASITVTELVVSPTMVRAALALRVDGATVVAWQWLDASVRHGDKTYAFNASDHLTRNPEAQDPAGDVNRFKTPDGSDVAHGTWTFDIPAVGYSLGDGSPDVRLEGPWTLTVAVP